MLATAFRRSAQDTDSADVGAEGGVALCTDRGDSGGLS